MSEMILIDGGFICHRSFHSHKDFCNKDGIGTGMLYGALQSIFYLMKKYKWKKEQVLLCWDGKYKWKYELFPDYKKGRKRTELPELMKISLQFKITKLAMTLLGVNQVHGIDEECDDVMLTLSKKCSKAMKGNGMVTLVSSDHDMYQSLTPDVRMMLLHTAGEEYYTDDMFIERSDIIPDDYWKIQALGGCKTDKVPGMPGIGEERAYRIVRANSWEKIVANDEKLVFSDTATKNAFRKNFKKWNMERDKKLVKLKWDVPYNLQKNKLNKIKLRKLFVKLGFKEYLNPNNFQKITELFA